MASETTSTSYNDPIFTSWVTSEIKEEQRPYSVVKSLFDNRGPGLPTKRYDWPTVTDPGAAASNQTEGTAFTNTSIATGVASATARLNGMVATVTDVVQAVAVHDVTAEVARILARSCAEEIETTFCALLDDFSNTVGSSGVDLTVAQFLSAINTLEQNDAKGALAAVLAPIQIGDLRTGVNVTANMNFASNPNMDTSIMSNLARDRSSGYALSLFNVDLYQTSATPSPNTAANRGGAIFVANSALGAYWVWDTKVETHRDAFQPGNQVACTNMYGVVEVLDREGVSIITDHE